MKEVVPENERVETAKLWPLIPLKEYGFLYWAYINRNVSPGPMSVRILRKTSDLRVYFLYTKECNLPDPEFWHFLGLGELAQCYGYN